MSATTGYLFVVFGMTDPRIGGGHWYPLYGYEDEDKAKECCEQERTKAGTPFIKYEVIHTRAPRLEGE